MKKLLLIFSILFGFLVNAISQTDIFAIFNSTYSGRNISINASKFIKGKHEIGGGIRFNINQLAHPDDQNKSYMKRLYATKPVHHIGIAGFYHRTILNKWEHLKPFVFYDIQATYSTTRNRMFLPYPYAYDINGDVLYKEYIEIFGPYTWVEQNIGFGFKAKLFSNWVIQQKIGVGASFILGYDKKRLDKYFNWFDWDFGYLINVGIGCRFGQKK